MQYVSSWDELQRLVARIDRRSSSFSTNIFATAEQFSNWRRPVRAIVTLDAVLVYYPEAGFQRLAHAAVDGAALTAALKLLPKAVYVADVIGRQTAVSDVSLAYEAVGFVRHATLIRMTKIQSTACAAELGEQGVSNDHSIAVASKDDAATVALMLERQLDPWVERVPDLDDLTAAASADTLLVAKQDSVLAGMLMYQVTGTLAHLRYWHVDQRRLGLGAGGALMRAFLGRCVDARRIVLWVIGDNARSIAIYRRYGFAEDGLLDEILVLEEGVRA